MDINRSSGILLHITSLPNRYGIGDLGPTAYEFVNFLVHTHQQYWQVLPLVPVGYGYSPYASPSTFAGNPLFISPDLLLEKGYLRNEDLAELPEFPENRVDFEQVLPFKFKLLERAFDLFEHHAPHDEKQQFDAFCKANQDWLEDYALFAVLKFVHEGKEWTQWEPALKCRDQQAMKEAAEKHARGILMQKFWQFLFDNQWRSLKGYCEEHGIKIIGDLPIYVAHDSADVWANSELFQLDAGGMQTVVAGVPPDYFSETGQRWGNPIYRWDLMQDNQFSWWIRRFASILKQVDIIRLDHFRGFEAYWEVPATEETAVKGKWVKGPNAALFDTLEQKMGTLPIIAENLGVITPEVVALMETFHFPGMAVLQFAFDGNTDSEFLPHNYPANIIAYTGTHDNDTVNGWWFNDTSTQDAASIERSRQFAKEYMLIQDEAAGVHWTMIRTLMASVANLVVTPLQDILGLGSEGRMNTPGTVGNPNWAWRFSSSMLTEQAVERFKKLTALFGRAPDPYR